MASTIIAPIGEDIESLASGLSAAPTTHWTDPGFEGLDALPAFVVGMPGGRRKQPDEAEDHISQYDWHLEYPVSIVCDMAVAETAQTQAVELLEAFIEAIDGGQDTFTSGLVQEAVVADWTEPEIVVYNKRALLVVECTVAVLAFVE